MDYPLPRLSAEGVENQPQNNLLFCTANTQSTAQQA
jgi:hypothetical protein